MLNVEKLRSAYGESEILHGLDLTVPKGEIVAIMGRNGMGKTTLMKTLMGIVPVRSGSISLDGHDVSTLKPQPVRVSANCAGVAGLAVEMRTARAMRPFADLLWWLTTERVPSLSCSTRTVTARSAHEAGTGPSA